MAQTFIQPGETIEFTAPGGGVINGVPLLIGGMVVIPQVTAAAAVRFNAVVTGVHTVPKTGGAAWTEGQVLYWDSAVSSFATAPSATARRAAIATVAALSGDTTGSAKLVNIGAAVNVA